MARPGPGPQLPHAPYSLALPADSTPGVSIHTYICRCRWRRNISERCSGGVTRKEPTGRLSIRAPAQLAVASGIRSITLLLLSLVGQEHTSCLLCRRRRSSRALSSSSRPRRDHSGGCCCLSCWPRHRRFCDTIRSAAAGTLEMSSLGGQQQHGRGDEARARLRWTRQLHGRFVLAVAQLGGADSEFLSSKSSAHELAARACPVLSLTACLNATTTDVGFRYQNIAEATPKSVMRAMAVSGLTLYHLKSHLQVPYIPPRPPANCSSLD
jgi:hypothetical protein